ncbi:MAG: tetratricopeptide repeat protein, partial [Planctomycetota bacterium]
MPTSAHVYRRLRIAALGLTFALPLLGPTAAVAQEGPSEAEQEEARERYDAAIKLGGELLADGDAKGALEQFNYCVAATGGANAGPLFLRAKAYKELEEFTFALEDIKEAMLFGQAIPGFDAEARHLRAEVYLDMGQLDRAIKDAEAAVKANRNNPIFTLVYGKILTLYGRITEAEKALDRYITFAESEQEDVELDPKDVAEAYRYRGQAVAGQTKYARGLKDLDKSIELDPEEHETYFTKALVLLQEEDYAAGAEALQLAIDNYTPEDPELEIPYSQAYLTRASALEELGKELAEEQPDAATAAYSEGVADCEKLLDVLPDNPQLAGTKSATLFRLGVLERLLGNLKPAVEAFTEAIDLNPGLGEGYFRRGVCYYYLDEPRLALGDFKQGAAINFVSPRSNLWIGRCHLELEEYRQAVKAFSSSVAVSPNYTTAYVHRGLTYLRLEEYRQAISDFDQAIRLAPKDGMNLYYRGFA